MSGERTVLHHGWLIYYLEIFYVKSLVQQDLPKEIRRVCKFMNREYSEAQLKQLEEYLSFDSLRKNKSVNNSPGDDKAVQFIRNGTDHFRPLMALLTYILMHRDECSRFRLTGYFLSIFF